MAKKSGGFTLIELMIVIQMISIIAAIAIPNLIRARINAAHSVAIGNLTGVNRAQAMFLISENGFSGSWETLQDRDTAFLDTNLGAGSLSGYDYELEGVGGETTTSSGVEGFQAFLARANPTNPNAIGAPIFYYYTDESGVIRWEQDEPAQIDSPPIFR